jgi:antitoxin HicB
MEPTYTVVLRPEPEGGFTVLVPALPEIVSYGKTLEEARRMAADAIRCTILGRQDLGEPVPEEGAVVSVPAEETEQVRPASPLFVYSHSTTN